MRIKPNWAPCSIYWINTDETSITHPDQMKGTRNANDFGKIIQCVIGDFKMEMCGLFPRCSFSLEKYNVQKVGIQTIQTKSRTNRSLLLLFILSFRTLDRVHSRNISFLFSMFTKHQHQQSFVYQMKNVRPNRRLAFVLRSVV